MKKSFLFFFLPILSYGQWHQLEYPNGGQVNSVYKTGSKIFAAGAFQTGKIYVTDANNIDWQLSPSPINVVNTFIKFGNRLLAGGGYQMSVSFDDGMSWNNIGFTGGYVKCLSAYGNRLLAGAIGVYLSNDSGNTWFSSNSGLPLNTGVYEITPIGSKIFLATNNGLYVSNNGGLSWSFSGTGITNNDVTSVINKSGQLFSGTYGGGIFISNDTGGTWTQVNTGILNLDILSMSTNGSEIYAISDSLFYKTSNNGQSWSNKLVGIGLPDLQKIISYTDTIFICSRGSGINMSTDFGDNFYSINKGLINNSVGSIQYYQNKAILIGDNGNSYSEDYGTTWQLKNNFCENVKFLGNMLIGVNASGVFFSTDFGSTWIPNNNGLTNFNFADLEVDGSKIYVLNDDGIFMWNNISNVWQSIFNGSLFSLKAVSGNIFACYYNTVYYSNNDGQTWEIRNNGLPSFINAGPIEANENTVFIPLAGYGIYKTLDNGLNWILSYSICCAALDVCGKFVVARDWAVNNFCSIYFSENNGETWKDITGNYSGRFVYSSSLINGEIWLLTSEDGVWATDLNNVITDDQQSNFIIYPNPSNGEIFISPFEKFSNPSLKIYDALGQEVFVLKENEMIFNAPINVAFLRSGIYFYKITSGTEVLSSGKIAIE